MRQPVTRCKICRPVTPPSPLPVSLSLSRRRVNPVFRLSHRPQPFVKVSPGNLRAVRSLLGSSRIVVPVLMRGPLLPRGFLVCSIRDRLPSEDRQVGRVRSVLVTVGASQPLFHSVQLSGVARVYMRVCVCAHRRLHAQLTHSSDTMVP